MDQKQPKYFLSLSNLLKLNIFNTIYAKCDEPCPKKENPCGEKSEPPSCPHTGAGDAGPHKCDCKVAAGAKGNSSDRGRTGAGVTGSRSRCDNNEDEKLPEGANNPGLLRHIHNGARFRLPQCFEGACVSVKQSTQSNWLLGHSISFSSVSPGGYKLMLSYMDRNKPAALPYFVMEAAPGGQMSCEFRVAPTPATRATMVAQVAEAELYSLESIMDAYSHTFTASVIAVNKEFIAFHYLQAITKEISLGAEVVARAQETEASSASGAGRWATGDHAVSATVGNRGLDLCYAKVVTPFLTTAAMLEVGFAIRRAVATLAYEWRTEEWTVRGSADSDGLVGCTLQRSVTGNRAKFTCSLSALLNHPNDKFRLGVGLSAAII